MTYAQVMQLKHKKLIAITIWLVTIAILGMSANVTSPSVVLQIVSGNG